MSILSFLVGFSVGAICAVGVICIIAYNKLNGEE